MEQGLSGKLSNMELGLRREIIKHGTGVEGGIIKHGTRVEEGNYQTWKSFYLTVGDYSEKAEYNCK